MTIFYFWCGHPSGMTVIRVFCLTMRQNTNNWCPSPSQQGLYLCHRHYRSCSALQPWTQSMSWSVSTSGRSACRARRAVAQPQSQRRLERWYCQTHTPTSFLPQDTIHSYINQKRRNLGDLVVPAGDHMNYSCLYIDISAQNEQTGDLCRVTHISSSLRP